MVDDPVGGTGAGAAEGEGDPGLRAQPESVQEKRYMVVIPMIAVAELPEDDGSGNPVRTKAAFIPTQPDRPAVQIMGTAQEIGEAMRDNVIPRCAEFTRQAAEHASPGGGLALPGKRLILPGQAAPVPGMGRPFGKLH